MLTKDIVGLGKRVAFVLAASCLGGCGWVQTTNPPAPVNPIAKEWQASVPANAPSVQDITWDEYFADPQLRALINAALTNNIDLRMSVARLEQARASYGVAKSAAYPSLYLGGSYQNIRSAQDLGQPGVPLLMRSYNVALEVLSYEIDFWGRIHATNQVARESYLASEQAARAFRISLIAEVAQAYLTKIQLAESIAVTREVLLTREEGDRLMMLRQQAGLSSELDVLQTKGLLYSARVSLATLEQQLIDATNALQILVVKMPENLPSGLSLAQQTFSPLGVGVPSEVLLARPDVQEAESVLRARQANIAAVRAAIFPTISLTAAYGRGSKELQKLSEKRNLTWTVTPKISQPLFTGGQFTSQLELAKAERDEALANYEKVLQQAFWEINGFLTSHEKLQEIVSAQTLYQDAQAKRVVLADARYRSGLTSYVEVLDAQRESFTATQNLLQAQSALLANSIKIYKALGGGDLKAETTQQSSTPEPTAATTTSAP